MLPNEDAQWVAAEMTRRFSLTRWSFTLSATDANRWMLRLARMVTQRPKVLVFSYSYHGTVDESFVVVDEGGERLDHATGQRRPLGGPDDHDARRRVQRPRRPWSASSPSATWPRCSVEPALTNIGIVLPLPGFFEGVRATVRRRRARC